ncbi:MAG: zinc ribbon domain-containing protein [Betaproteobacteria bacterium]|nr:MAG: zinc ribbon domain-containing protein [Betaproteobacteria bacterium]
MPIYEYACPDCGAQDEHMQKLADAPLTVCPKCGGTNYTKKISAAGFALKGSGWYVTDFRNGSSGGKATEKKDGATPAADSAAPAKTDAATPAPAAAAPAAPSPAPAPTSSPAPAAG